MELLNTTDKHVQCIYINAIIIIGYHVFRYT